MSPVAADDVTSHDLITSKPPQQKPQWNGAAFSTRSESEPSRYTTGALVLQ